MAESANAAGFHGPKPVCAGPTWRSLPTTGRLVCLVVDMPPLCLRTARVVVDLQWWHLHQAPVVGVLVIQKRRGLALGAPRAPFCLRPCRLGLLLRPDPAIQPTSCCSGSSLTQSFNTRHPTFELSGSLLPGGHQGGGAAFSLL